MSSTRLYVGNLSFGSTELELERVFREYGDVMAVEVITNGRTGRPRGFAYVEMRHPEAARAARDALNGVELDGRILRVDLARPKQGAGHQDELDAESSSRKASAKRTV